MSSAEPDVNQVRFVTERFEELKGLRSVAVGAAVSLVCGGFLAASEAARPPRAWEVQVVLVVALLPAGVAMYFVDRYYVRRFGRVRSRSLSPWADPLYWLIILGMPLALRLANGAAVVLSIWGIHWLRIVWRDWPHRAHHLLGVAAAALAVTVTCGADPSNLGSFQLWGLLIGAAGAILVGGLDHLMLARVMRSPVLEIRRRSG